MSTSVAIVNSGTVALDSAMRRAMTCWVRESSWTLTSPFAVPVSATLAGRRRAPRAARGGLRLGGRRLGGRGRRPRRAPARPAARRGRLRGGAGGGRLDVGLHDPPARARCPAAPERSMPCSRAMRRATGEAFARPPLPSGDGAGGAARLRGLAARRRRGRLGGGGRRGCGRRLARRAVARRLGLLRRLGRRAVARRRLAAGADARDDLADGQRVALLGDDRQRAGACRPRRSSWPCRSRSPRARRRGRPRRPRP